MRKISCSSKLVSSVCQKIGLVAIALSVGASWAAAIIHFEPVDLRVSPILAGQKVACQVVLEGGPQQVTLTSNPPGAVSFSGEVSQADSTIMADTASNVVGPVTVYLTTGGTRVVEFTTVAVPLPEYNP